MQKGISVAKNYEIAAVHKVRIIAALQLPGREKMRHGKVPGFFNLFQFRFILK